jgi:nucleoside-diphosphate-sugar epimerase
MNLLIIGGSGFVSGTLARIALEHGHSVSTVTRGQREIPEGAQSIVVDRKDREAFA